MIFFPVFFLILEFSDVIPSGDGCGLGVLGCGGGLCLFSGFDRKAGEQPIEVLTVARGAGRGWVPV